MLNVHKSETKHTDNNNLRSLRHRQSSDNPIRNDQNQNISQDGRDSLHDIEWALGNTVSFNREIPNCRYRDALEYTNYYHWYHDSHC